MSVVDAMRICRRQVYRIENVRDLGDIPNSSTAIEQTFVHPFPSHQKKLPRLAMVSAAC